MPGYGNKVKKPKRRTKGGPYLLNKGTKFLTVLGESEAKKVKPMKKKKPVKKKK